MAPAVPDRWLNYSCHGKVVANRFIALKVPLARRNCVPNGMRFTPEDVLNTLPLGLIVDLTNTTRYYDPRVFTSNGVEHVKLALPGRVVPSWQKVERFVDTVNGYLNDPRSSGKLIGVHCTHGLNRTGYLVCAYMILELGYRPDEAISLFNFKRGHEMERENYLRNLHDMRPKERVTNHPLPIYSAAPPDRRKHECWPTVRSRNHNFRVPSYRQTSGHSQQKHSQF
uniref:Tyrosine specific protein phosphatases domain-containing protein n=1 Tax=Anopheles farauti TaxID=69004 RepID=A0A9I3GIN5_9DIPT